MRTFLFFAGGVRIWGTKVFYSWLHLGHLKQTSIPVDFKSFRELASKSPCNHALWTFLVQRRLFFFCPPLTLGTSGCSPSDTGASGCSPSDMGASGCSPFDPISLGLFSLWWQCALCLLFGRSRKAVLSLPACVCPHVTMYLVWCPEDWIIQERFARRQLLLLWLIIKLVHIN